ncbi:hypothetical protein EXN32_21965 [Agrobacterium tumefaciens]|uniref:hypothetical protein n=1 Tax=Agrobacterium TaxID=357 RepID=UPI00115D93CE|nr:MULTISPECIES: hypothetical protein [Agrobacterium]MDA5241145.1 hypothetical protein [Agrobacterium sp. MAFF310724]MDA5249564.1 hypothetical protein [Agrobacterium sp. MAFF210268]TRB12373.1 hypothetical protein EXN32_21965 [Agrobacterium tumefaciens]
MANVDKKKLFDLFASKATTKTVGRAGTPADPVSKFLEKLKAQRETANKLTRNTEINRADWYSRRGDGYVVRIGSSPISIEGKTHFEAATKAEVVELLDAAEKLIQSDDDIRAQIIKRSEERSRKLREAKKK